MTSESAKHQSVRSLLAADATEILDDSNLDDQLWTLLCARVSDPSSIRDAPAPVGHYYASRLVQWEVGNGGLTQAAYSAPLWFEQAAAGYDELGKKDVAALLRRARLIIPDDADDLEALEDQFEALDSELFEMDWEIDDLRVAYVREHRDAFSVF